MHHTELCALPNWWRVCAFFALLTPFAGPPAFAQHEQSSSTFQVFVAAEGVAGHGQPHPRGDDTWADADVIFGLNREQFRLFGEYFISPEEHELERFQVGYEVVPDTVIWLGRFNQPASAWDTEHHHGDYLQTAITRPAIENWEDEEGLIPQHITGALLESHRPIGTEAGMQLSAGVGAAPALRDEDNEPINLIGSNPGKHGLSYTGRLAFLPDYTGTSSAGLLLGHDQLFVTSAIDLSVLRSGHADLNIFGAYADWSVDAWRFIGTGYYIDVALDRPNPHESFMSAYLQVERQLPHRLTAFGRVEGSSRMRESRYVAFLSSDSTDIDLAIRREAGGVRWDYAHRQALTFEVDHEVSLSQHGYEVRLQWSAAIP